MTDLYLPPPEQDVVELNVVVVCVGLIRLVQSSLHPADELVLVPDIHPDILISQYPNICRCDPGLRHTETTLNSQVSATL